MNNVVIGQFHHRDVIRNSAVEHVHHRFVIDGTVLSGKRETRMFDEENEEKQTFSSLLIE